MKLLITVLLCIQLPLAYAIDVIPVKKGDTVSKDGFFVDPSNMKKFRQINEEKKILSQENIKLKDLSVIDNQRIELYKDHSSEVEKQLGTEKLKGNIKGIGGFLIGVLATSVAAYAAIRISK